MSNGRLQQDMKKCKKRSSCKDSTSKSEANPFIFTKKKDFWASKEGLTYLEGLARKGLTDEELSQAMGIAKSTLWVWCNENQDIRDAIIHARAWQIHEIENVMYKCATGYEYEEETVTKDGDIVVVKKYAPPSIEAQKFILCNRSKGMWKSAQRIELEADVNSNVNVSKSDMLSEELFGDGK